MTLRLAVSNFYQCVGTCPVSDAPASEKMERTSCIATWYQS